MCSIFFVFRILFSYFLPKREGAQRYCSLCDCVCICGHCCIKDELVKRVVVVVREVLAIVLVLARFCTGSTTLIRHTHTPLDIFSRFLFELLEVCVLRWEERCSFLPTHFYDYFEFLGYSRVVFVRRFFRLSFSSGHGWVSKMRVHPGNGNILPGTAPTTLCNV